MKHFKKHFKEYFKESLKYDFKEEAVRSGILLGAFQRAMHIQVQTFQEKVFGNLGTFRFFRAFSKA